MRYNELKMVYFEPEGRPVAFFSSWWRLSEMVVKLYETRPDMANLHEIYYVTGWRRIWYLYRYPYLKIK